MTTTTTTATTLRDSSRLASERTAWADALEIDGLLIDALTLIAEEAAIRSPGIELDGRDPWGWCADLDAAGLYDLSDRVRVVEAAAA